MMAHTVVSMHEHARSPVDARARQVAGLLSIALSFALALNPNLGPLRRTVCEYSVCDQGCLFLGVPIALMAGAGETARRLARAINAALRWEPSTSLSLEAGLCSSCMLHLAYDGNAPLLRYSLPQGGVAPTRTRHDGAASGMPGDEAAARGIDAVVLKLGVPPCASSGEHYLADTAALMCGWRTLHPHLVRGDAAVARGARVASRVHAHPAARRSAARLCSCACSTLATAAAAKAANSTLPCSLYLTGDAARGLPSRSQGRRHVPSNSSFVVPPATAVTSCGTRQSFEMISRVMWTQDERLRAQLQPAEILETWWSMAPISLASTQSRIRG